MKIGVILPSRGLIFSRTAEDIIRNVNQNRIPHKIYFSHRKPIPECFNDPLEKALEDKEITHIWIVEDDMSIPDGVLVDLLSVDKAVVVADYPITKDGAGSVFRDADGRVLYSGTGCMLIKREVFEELKKPYFTTSLKWNVKNYGNHIKFFAVENAVGDGYGLHDITFCFNLEHHNIPIHVIKTKLGQRKLIELGRAGTNNGAHNIETWTKIIKDKRLKEIQSYPAEKTGNLVTVVTPTGEVNCSAEHAKKLVKLGRGKIPPKKASHIVWTLLSA